ncbi:MAG: hypothetical protein FWB99_12135 [Treponema sp.]|nr:hypothetical protein [Treponema sp.]
MESSASEERLPWHSAFFEALQCAPRAPLLSLRGKFEAKAAHSMTRVHGRKMYFFFLLYFVDFDKGFFKFRQSETLAFCFKAY